jgi:hypothetical protein
MTLARIGPSESASAFCCYTAANHDNSPAASAESARGNAALSNDARRSRSRRRRKPTTIKRHRSYKRRNWTTEREKLLRDIPVRVEVCACTASSLSSFASGCRHAQIRQRGEQGGIHAIPPNAISSCARSSHGAGCWQWERTRSDSHSCTRCSSSPGYCPPGVLSRRQSITGSSLATSIRASAGRQSASDVSSFR